MASQVGPPVPKRYAKGPCSFFQPGIYREFAQHLFDGHRLVGASGDDDAGDRSGSAYVFERQQDGSWLELEKLVASDGTAGDEFGMLV